MRKTTAIRNPMLTVLTALAAFAGASALQAHHTYQMYDPTPIWVTGTVIEFEDIDPHTITTLEERSADGQVRRWGVEGPARFQLDGLRADLYLPEVGDTIEFCAFPYKSEAELSHLWPEADFSGLRSSADADGSAPRREFVWGHVMVVPDGAMQLWNPHGVMGECVGSSNDQRRSWADFLNADVRARQNWCAQQQYPRVQTNASLKALVEEINALIGNAC